MGDLFLKRKCFRPIHMAQCWERSRYTLLDVWIPTVGGWNGRDQAEKAELGMRLPFFVFCSLAWGWCQIRLIRVGAKFVTRIHRSFINEGAVDANNISTFSVFILTILLGILESYNNWYMETPKEQNTFHEIWYKRLAIFIFPSLARLSQTVLTPAFSWQSGFLSRFEKLYAPPPPPKMNECLLKTGRNPQKEAGSSSFAIHFSRVNSLFVFGDDYPRQDDERSRSRHRFVAQESAGNDENLMGFYGLYIFLKFMDIWIYKHYIYL